MDTVSQLDEDTSTALATIREWRNSLVPINRIPSEILSLIPTHLSSQKDRFHTTFVCRYWRRANVRHGALWTQLFLRRGEDYVSTLLERARASPLDIVTHHDVPVTMISQISTLAQRIRHLECSQTSWNDVITFSEFNFGQLPLLRALKITTITTRNQPDEVAPPSLPFFRGSADLEEFSLHSDEYQFLNLFIFPNLTRFELSSHTTERHCASLLLDFLRASPMLRVVKLDINRHIRLEDVAKDTVVILPNAEIFSLQVRYDEVGYVYDVATHISCPCARDTSLMRKIDAEDMRMDLEVFPSPTLWDTIVGWYATSSIEEVEVEVKHEPFDATACSVTFLSSNAPAIRLGFEVSEMVLFMDSLSIPVDDICWEVFSRALRTVRDHPLSYHIKHLRIKFRAHMSYPDQVVDLVDEAVELFSLLESLDKLTIHGCDLHIFLARFLEDTELPHIEFPPIKELTILHPLMDVDVVECMNAIAELAMLQHGLDIPFERVTIRAEMVPTGMVEKLKPWVGVVDCCEEQYSDE